MSSKPEETNMTASTMAGLKRNEKEVQKPKPEPSDDQEETEPSFDIPQRFTKSGRRRAVPFTIKLMKVLSDKRNSDIITWMPSGKSFSVLKPKLFVANILPAEFKTAKYSSFTRKLHRWGFMKHYRGEEAGAFYHKDFQKGNLELVEKMVCHKPDPPKSRAVLASVSKKTYSGPAATATTAAPKITTPKAVAATPKSAPIMAKSMPVGSFASRKTTATRRFEFRGIAQVNARTPAVFMASPVATMPPVQVSATALKFNSATLPPMVPEFSGSTTNMAAATTTYDSDRLNAAINLEVNRRMNASINAMALSRQVFAISALRQQQLMTRRTNTNSQIAAALLLQKQAGGLGNVAAATSIASGLAGVGYRATAGQGRSMPGAPTTNIQGARTA